MASYIKIFPNHMELNSSEGKIFVKLRYSVEQYGLMTGPFDLCAVFHPEKDILNVEPWVVHFNSRPQHNELFHGFFTYLNSYINKYHGISPLDQIKEGKSNFFEMYFPKIYYQYMNAHQTGIDANILFFKDVVGASVPMSLSIA